MFHGRIFLTLWLILTTCLTCWAIKGYDFGDNKINKFVGPDNGILRAEMAGYFPSSLTICLRFYLTSVRGKIGLVNIYSPYDDVTMPFYNIHSTSWGWIGTELYGKYRAEHWGEINYQNKNLVRKWASICVGLDYIEDLSTFSFNGKEANRTDIQEWRKQRLDSRLPAGYFSGNIHKPYSRHNNLRSTFFWQYTCICVLEAFSAQL